MRASAPAGRADSWPRSTKAGDLGGREEAADPDEVKALVAERSRATRPAAKLIFRRKELQCLACHAYGGAGGQVGPDMTSIGASAQPDYLVESLLMPNKAVKEGYHAIRVVTTEDKVISASRSAKPTACSSSARPRTRR